MIIIHKIVDGLFEVFLRDFHVLEDLLLYFLQNFRNFTVVFYDQPSIAVDIGLHDLTTISTV